MKITVYELLGMVKEDKAPARIKIHDRIFRKGWLDYFGDEPIEEYYIDDENNNWIDTMCISLDDEVELLEEKKIPEKLQGSCDMTTSEICRMNNIEVKINEIIDYLKSKGE